MMRQDHHDGEDREEGHDEDRVEEANVHGITFQNCRDDGLLLVIAHQGKTTTFKMAASDSILRDPDPAPQSPLNSALRTAISPSRPLRTSWTDSRGPAPGGEPGWFETFRPLRNGRSRLIP